MIYRIKELKGDTIPVPQLIFSKLGIAEEYNVRVALYVLATGITDPDKLCADLKLAAASLPRAPSPSGPARGCWSATTRTPPRAQSLRPPPP